MLRVKLALALVLSGFGPGTLWSCGPVGTDTVGTDLSALPLAHSPAHLPAELALLSHVPVVCVCVCVWRETMLRLPSYKYKFTALFVS